MNKNAWLIYALILASLIGVDAAVWWLSQVYASFKAPGTGIGFFLLVPILIFAVGRAISLGDNAKYAYWKAKRLHVDEFPQGSKYRYRMDVRVYEWYLKRPYDITVYGEHGEWFYKNGKKVPKVNDYYNGKGDIGLNADLNGCLKGWLNNAEARKRAAEFEALDLAALPDDPQLQAELEKVRMKVHAARNKKTTARST